MIEKVTCPFCSCVVRRQNAKTQAFMNRFISHMMTHYSVVKQLEEEE